MSYKKYIKKDGRLYGPYIYESKRIDGKVVSEYHGSRKNVNLKKFAWIFASAVFVLFLAYFLTTIDYGNLTGNVILNTNLDYTEEQPISGNVSLLLNQGELIPSSSKLILENSGQSYEYSLNELVSNRPAQGSFYVKGVSLSGNGEGYGIEGEKQVYPNIAFVLQIYQSSGENQSSGQTENNNSGNETRVNDNASISEPVLNENITTIEENNVQETTTNENGVSQEQTSTDENTNSELASPTEDNTETTTETASSPITGFFMKIYSFFLALTPTGNAISEVSAKEITGQTSFGNPFVYNLSGGEGVQLKPGSVSVLGSSISEDNIKISVSGNQVIVETSYSTTEKGFGEQYQGNDKEILSINLSALGLVLNEGELIAKIVYGDKEIISSKTFVMPGATKLTSENVSNSTIMNVTIEKQNKSIANATTILPGLQIINSETASLILTEEEKVLLAQEYGQGAQVETAKSEIFNGMLIKRYVLGTQWIEYSYNPNLSENELEYQMSLDRMKWLKDLAYRLKTSKAKVVQNAVPSENFSIE